MIRACRIPAVLSPLLLGVFGFLVLGIVSGCSESSWEVERSVVSGSVSYQGEPVQDGLIKFVPTEGTEGPVSAAPIENGEYTIDAQGGVPVGKHRVEIEAQRDAEQTGGGPAEIPGVEGPPQEQYLPEKYNRQSELEATIEADGPVTKDFQLAE